MRLLNKVAVVTAAAQGIGRAIAVAMAKEGATVWATDVNEMALESLKGTKNISVARLDVLNQGAINAFFSRFEKLDILVNCTGIVHNGTVLEATNDQWEMAFNLNVRAHSWTIKAGLPLMLAGGGGGIINISSVASSIKGVPNRCVYGATKAAIIGMTKAIAADYIRDGIRCNSIAPGTVDTPSLQDRINASADPDAARKDFIARQPMGRLAVADEIAPLAVFLGSDESSFVTGQTYAIDGGMSI